MAAQITCNLPDWTKAVLFLILAVGGVASMLVVFIGAYADELARLIKAWKER